MILTDPRTVGEFCYIVNLLVTATSSDLNLLVQLFLPGCTFFVISQACYIERANCARTETVFTCIISIVSNDILYAYCAGIIFFTRVSCSDGNLQLNWLTD